MLRSAGGAADSLSLAYDEVATRGRRVGEARGLVRLGDRSQHAGDGARRQGGGAVRNVEDNRPRRRGESCKLVLAHQDSKSRQSLR